MHGVRIAAGLGSRPECGVWTLLGPGRFASCQSCDQSLRPERRRQRLLTTRACDRPTTRLDDMKQWSG
eukprot:6958158-Alexandrium_andersonii.AAC.1